MSNTEQQVSTIGDSAVCGPNAHTERQQVSTVTGSDIEQPRQGALSLRTPGFDQPLSLWTPTLTVTLTAILWA